jgi:hypothetical protein
MIRHVSVFTLKEGADVARVRAAVDLLVERVPGAVAYAYGSDLGLRAGNGGFALSFDFPDEAAYRAWDTDPEHERIRRELILPHLTGVLRCQFRLP